MRAENSFLPVRGVGETRERRLWEAGVTHWDEFAGQAVGDTLADRIEAFIGTARERLAAGDPAFFAEAFPGTSHWRLYENFREGACFLDIETTGLSKHRDEVTVVGLRRGGETRTLVRGRDLDRERLRRALADADLLVTYNGRRFDVPFLEASFGLEIDRPHVDLMDPCRRLGLTGGLKGVEAALGVERDRPDLSGEDAVRLWRRHRRGEDGALETLLAYNREDVDNLVAVMDAVADRLHRSVFAPASPDGTGR
ncbi:MAG: ribonuclease H-like domain-containing protein [Halobacteriales archaeon]